MSERPPIRSAAPPLDESHPARSTAVASHQDAVSQPNSMKATMTPSHEWVTSADAWRSFIKTHPELGYREGKWQFHNFLRFHREHLIAKDAIRKARKRFWVAHLSRFIEAAFECAAAPSTLFAKPVPQIASGLRAMADPALASISATRGGESLAAGN